MALFHLNVTQIKRSKGQSAIAAAAYRAGEKLHSEYYGESSDYTNKQCDFPTAPADVSAEPVCFHCWQVPVGVDHAPCFSDSFQFLLFVFVDGDSCKAAQGEPLSGTSVTQRSPDIQMSELAVSPSALHICRTCIEVRP